MKAVVQRVTRAQVDVGGSTVGQIGTGWLSDHVGRKPLIVAGMLIQAAALGLLIGCERELR